MKYSDHRIFSCWSSAAFMLLPVALAATACAQGSSRASIANNPSGPFTDSIERRQREAALRSLKVDPVGRPASERIDPGIVEQLSEDFRELQIIRLEMVRDIANAQPFGYKRLEKDTAEIGKRAGRLKMLLALSGEQGKHGPVPEPEVFDREQIQTAAARLCLEISRFIENRMFKSASTYNARDAVEAAATLELVINLSAGIRNSAERLRKTK